MNLEESAVFNISDRLQEFTDLREKLRAARIKKNQEKIQEIMKQNQVDKKAIGMQGLIDRVKHRSLQDAEKNFHHLMHQTKKESENLEIEDHIVELIKEETKQVGN